VRKKNKQTQTNKQRDTHVFARLPAKTSTTPSQTKTDPRSQPISVEAQNCTGGPYVDG
jgi:hypothetical protein